MADDRNPTRREPNDPDWGKKGGGQGGERGPMRKESERRGDPRKEGGHDRSGMGMDDEMWQRGRTGSVDEEPEEPEVEEEEEDEEDR